MDTRILEAFRPYINQWEMYDLCLEFGHLKEFGSDQRHGEYWYCLRCHALGEE